MPPLEPRSEFLSPGKNGIETSVAIMDVLSGFSGVKRTIEREKVKDVFRRLNAGGIRYVLIGGLAYAEYAPPRATQDIDLIVLAEDVGKVRQLFPGCCLRRTAIAGIYEFEGTRFDVQPARLRAQAAVVLNAVDGTFESEPIRLATFRDLVFLKLWASVERKEVGKKLLDQADIANLLEYNPEKLSAQDIASIAQDILAIGYTSEEAARLRGAVAWLNETLDKLGLPDRKFPLV